MGATPRKLCSKGRTAIKPKFLVILGPSLDADRLSAHHQGKKKSTHVVETSVSHFEGNTVAYAVFIVDKLRVASWKASSLQKASCHRH